MVIVGMKTMRVLPKTISAVVGMGAATSSIAEAGIALGSRKHAQPEGQAS